MRNRTLEFSEGRVRWKAVGAKFIIGLEVPADLLPFVMMAKIFFTDLDMRTFSLIALVLLASLLQTVQANSFQMPQGKYAVGTTQLSVAKKYEKIRKKKMDAFLQGDRSKKKGAIYLDQILEDPENSLITPIKIPNEKHFEPHAGDEIPLVMFVAYPTTQDNSRESYDFPYSATEVRTLPRMQRGEDKPIFADASKKYPLIILSHGRSAHAVYDIGHANALASHGYIVAGLFYGDDRLKNGEEYDRYKHYMRPLMTSQALDYLLAHDDFKNHIDQEKIAASGHSFGGFTILALAGGNIFGENNLMKDTRIKAGLVSAPWVGGTYGDFKYYVFGDKNKSLNKVEIPLLGLFGTKDSVTKKSYVLPALSITSGPRHVVELVNQEHIYEPGSWQDQGHWELLFFDAYLKGNKSSLQRILKATEAEGGNEDRQLFDYLNG